MKPHVPVCRYCHQETQYRCPECGAWCCMSCGVNLCPLCVRVRLVQIEKAFRDRLVPWQHIEVTMMPIRSGAFLSRQSLEKDTKRSSSRS